MTRRCLICANLNPCQKHSQGDQAEELRRNDEEIAKYRKETSMAQVTLTLFDFSDPANVIRTEVAMVFDPNMDIRQQGNLKIVIGVGDDVACSTISTPLNLVMNLINAAMDKHRQAKNSGLVGFAKPDLIVPN